MDIRQTNYKKGSYGLIIKIINMNRIVYISENLVNYIFFEEKITIIKEMTYITTEVKSRARSFEPL